MILTTGRMPEPAFRFENRALNQRARPNSFQTLPVLGMHTIGPAQPFVFSPGLPCVNFPRRLNRLEGSLRVGRPDDGSHSPDQRAVTFFAFSQRFFCLLSRRDIDSNA